MFRVKAIIERRLIPAPSFAIELIGQRQYVNILFPLFCEWLLGCPCFLVRFSRPNLDDFMTVSFVELHIHGPIHLGADTCAITSSSIGMKGTFDCLACLS